MNQCDWLDDFIQKLGHYEEIQNLKEKKFHGNLNINFCEGEIMNYNLNIHRRAVNIDGNSTLTQKEDRYE